MDGIDDPYAVLGVSDNAGPAVIRHAYRAMMRKYHPDLNSDEHAAARARAVNEAYRMLRDPTSRARYDQNRSYLRQLTRDRYVIFVPRIRERMDKRQKSKQRKWDVRHAHSWTPLIFFIFIAAASLAATVNSGIFDPPATAFPVVDTVKVNLEHSKSIDALIARFVNNDPVSSNSPSKSGDNNFLKLSEDREFADKESPLLLSDVAEGSGKFAEVSQNSGMRGAKHFSINCHRRVKLSPSLRGTDQCASFDYTAAYVDIDVARSTNSRRDDYFDNQNKTPEENYRFLGLTSYAAESRIAEIRNAVRSIVNADYRNIPPNK